MKRFYDEQCDLENWALGFLCGTRTLRCCEVHGVYFEGSNDLETAYRALNKQVTDGKIVLGNGETRRDKTDALKQAYETYSGLEACGMCDEAFGKDD